MQDGWTPLYIAAQNGHVQIVKALLRSGAAQVDVIDKVDQNTYVLLDLLRRVSPQPSYNVIFSFTFTALQEGNTPLIVASKYGQTAVAELLLLGGADYFIRNAVSYD